MTSRLTIVSAAALVAIATSGTADATIVRVLEENFIAGSGLITFDEFPQNTANPTYTPADYGGGAGSPTVTFGGFFAGQTLSLTPGVDCPGAAPTACIVGSPSGPLTLDGAAPQTFITGDGAAPNSPVLSGTPRFNGPVAVALDVDVAGIGFDAGFFDATNSTGITAFGRDGSLIGSVTNLGLGIEFLGLATQDGSESIAGVFLDLIGSEPAGFAIDSLRFGRAGQVVLSDPPVVGVSEPLSLGLVGFGLAAICLAAHRRSERSKAS